MAMRLICFLLAVCTLCALPLHARAQSLLNLPYAKPAGNTANAYNTTGFKCRVPAYRVPEVLEFTSRYNKDDPERDDIDIENQAEYRNQTGDLARFEAQLLQMTNAYFAGGENTQPVLARCALTWLDSWAKNDALLGPANGVGMSVRHWTLASLASAYAQIRDEKTLPIGQRQRVEDWLASIARAVIEDYDHGVVRRQNNLSYWAAWAVSMTGIAVNDSTLFDWGMARAENAVFAIQPDGSLPLELGRGTKALVYHQFALTPLLMLAEAGMHNGRDIYKLNDGRLLKLAKRVLMGFKTTAYFEKKTGLRQTGIESFNGGHLAWIEVYNARFPTSQIKKMLPNYRPMVSRRMGGDMTLLFGNRSSTRGSSASKPAHTDIH